MSFPGLKETTRKFCFQLHLPASFSLCQAFFVQVSACPSSWSSAKTKLLPSTSPLAILHDFCVQATATSRETGSGNYPLTLHFLKELTLIPSNFVLKDHQGYGADSLLSSQR